MNVWNRLKNLWYLSGQVPESITNRMTFFRSKQAQIVDLIDPLDKIEL